MKLKLADNRLMKTNKTKKIEWIGGLVPPKIMRAVLKELLQTVNAIGGLVPPQNYRDSNIGRYPPERISRTQRENSL